MNALEILTGNTVALPWPLTPTVSQAGGSIAQPTWYLSPGWSDLQVNGFAGWDLNDPVQLPAAAGQVARQLWAEGVASYFATVVTAAPASMAQCLQSLAYACRHETDARRSVAGIHLEGPYLASLDGARGAHAAEHLHAPNWEEFCRWQAMAEGRIRVVTLAPELPGALDLIARLVQSGVAVAIGHTQADSTDLAAAAAAGATLSTHLGNGIAQLLPRHPNPIWDQLADDRLYASVIFDGHHLPANVMRVLVRAKGSPRTVLISDAVALARMAPGRYTAPVGGEVELLPNGRLVLVGSDYLAGSTSCLREGIENAVRLAGCSLPEAVAMASVNPWHAIRATPPDNTATVFAWDAGQQALTVQATVIDGAVVYALEPLPTAETETRHVG